MEEKAGRLITALTEISEMECLASHPDDCECCLKEEDPVGVAKLALEETAQ
jgi:hypothetical protein